MNLFTLVLFLTLILGFCEIRAHRRDRDRGDRRNRRNRQQCDDIESTIYNCDNPCDNGDSFAVFPVSCFEDLPLAENRPSCNNRRRDRNNRENRENDNDFEEFDRYREEKDDFSEQCTSGDTFLYQEMCGICFSGTRKNPKIISKYPFEVENDCEENQFSCRIIDEKK
jgi:hypothetical protein